MEDIPLHETLFVLEYNLTKEFPALSPFDIEESAFEEIIELYADVRTVQIRAEKENDPDRVIRRPAGNNWF